MAKHLVVAVDWYGPYPSIADARAALKDFEAPGLYFALGKDVENSAFELKYVGISTSIQSRVSMSHEKLALISGDIELWLGEVGTARPSGRLLKKIPATLDYAEWLLAYFLQTPLNVKKTKSIPDVAVTLLNRWWSTNYETPCPQRPHRGWPDLIDYLGHSYPTKIVWFGGEVVTKPPLNSVQS